MAPRRQRGAGRPRPAPGQRRRNLRRRTRGEGRAIRALPLPRLGARSDRGSADALRVREAWYAVHPRVCGGTDWDRDAPRDGRARNRLAHAAPVLASGALVGSPPRRLRDRVLRGGLRRVAPARRHLRRRLRRAPRRHGARPLARILVVDPRRRRVRSHRGAADLRQPVPDRGPRAGKGSTAPADVRAVREGARRGRNPAEDREGERRHEPGQRLRVRDGAVVTDRALGHAPRRPLLDPRGRRGPGTRAGASLEQPHPRGDRLVRAVRPARRVRPDARHATARRDGRAGRGATRAARLGDLLARRAARAEPRQPRHGGGGRLEGVADDPGPRRCPRAVRGVRDDLARRPEPTDVADAWQARRRR